MQKMKKGSVIMKELSKRQMIDEIKKVCKVSRYELQIMSKAFVEHVYRTQVLNEDLPPYDMS